MSKREDYKRFIIFLLASLIVLAQMAILLMSGTTFTEDRSISPSGVRVTGY